MVNPVKALSTSQKVFVAVFALAVVATVALSVMHHFDLLKKSNELYFSLAAGGGVLFGACGAIFYKSIREFKKFEQFDQVWSPKMSLTLTLSASVAIVVFYALFGHETWGIVATSGGAVVGASAYLPLHSSLNNRDNTPKFEEL